MINYNKFYHNLSTSHLYFLILEAKIAPYIYTLTEFTMDAKSEISKYICRHKIISKELIFNLTMSDLTSV